MVWRITTTETFSREYRKHRKNKELAKALDRKIQRLKTKPIKVGAYLSGRLHRCKSTRLIKKYRLIFMIDEKNSTVSLLGIDHRKFNYDRF